MRKSEVPLVLSALGQFQFVQADEVAVEMWHASLDEDMSAAFATSFIAQHYADPTLGQDKVMPGHVNKAWRDYRRRQSVPQLPRGAEASDRHCGRQSCTCTHTDPCYRGWMDDVADAAVPCRKCRQELHDLIAGMPEPGARSSADMAVLRGRSLRATGDHFKEAS